MSVLKSLCRLCLVKLPISNHNSMLDNEIDQKLCKLLCFKLVKDVDLPEGICEDCFTQLNKYLKFREQCINTESLLSQFLGCRNKTSIMAMTDFLNSSSNNYLFLKRLLDDDKNELEIIKNKKIKNMTLKRTKRVLKGCRIRNIESKKEPPQKRDNISRHNFKLHSNDHPIPNGGILLESNNSESQVMFADLCSIIDDKSTPNKKKSKRIKGESKPTSFICKFCQKSYPSEGGWRYHVHTVHNKFYQPFICDLCGKPFKVKKNLEAHKNAVHFHIKQNLCDLCGRGFATKYALNVHKTWHSGEKNFPCEICGFRFNTLSKVNTHRTTHGGPKKFMCEVCSRKFRWKKDFDIHIRSHTGEKPFNCRFCNKAFSSVANMKKHEKSHMKVISDDECNEIPVEVLSTHTNYYQKTSDHSYKAEIP